MAFLKPRLPNLHKRLNYCCYRALYIFCIKTVDLRGGLGGEAASLLVVTSTCLLPNDVLLPTVFAEQIYCSPYTILAS